VTAIHISDPETDALVRQLAESRSVGLTEAIKVAVKNELARDGITAPRTTSRMTDSAILLEELEAIIRSTTLDYTRLRAKKMGTKGVGSRVYQMLHRHGPVETLRRLVQRPTEGLKFLKDADRIDLAAETIALDWRFKTIIDEDILSRARANLEALQG
jgi:hypothetical protein